MAASLQNNGIFPYLNSTQNRNTLIDKTSNAQEKTLIENLGQISPILFTANFIQVLFKLYALDVYNIHSASMLSELLKCNIFNELSRLDNQEEIDSLEKILNIYFNSLANTTPGVSAMQLKTKICSLVKMEIKIPAYKNGITMKNINVNVSSNYKPTEGKIITASCDIVNVIKDNFINNADHATIEQFSFTPKMSSVQLQGPILKDVMNAELNMQSQMITNGISFGVHVDSFIENTKRQLF